VQHLARDTTDVPELWKEVTRVWATTVVVEAQATRAKKVAQESVVLLASARGEAGEVAQKVSLLEGKLAVA
jgi:hypothetical protein